MAIWQWSLQHNKVDKPIVHQLNVQTGGNNYSSLCKVWLEHSKSNETSFSVILPGGLNLYALVLALSFLFPILVERVQPHGSSTLICVPSSKGRGWNSIMLSKKYINSLVSKYFFIFVFISCTINTCLAHLVHLL